MVLGAPRTQHLETRPLSLRSLPSIERLLQSEGGASLIDVFGRPLTVDALRNELAAARLLVPQGKHPAPAPQTSSAGTPPQPECPTRSQYFPCDQRYRRDPAYKPPSRTAEPGCLRGDAPRRGRLQYPGI